MDAYIKWAAGALRELRTCPAVQAVVAEAAGTVADTVPGGEASDVHITRGRGRAHARVWAFDRDALRAVIIK